MDLNFIKEKCLVFDIETSAHYPNGDEININTNFDDYIQYAKCKFVGCYSYKYNKEYYFEVSKHADKIKKLISEHFFIVTFNGEEFDFPILVNNGLADSYQRFSHVDCMKILGQSSFKDKNGYKYKGRGDLMKYKFKKNSLQCVAETMGLEFQKSPIDYKIFAKEYFTKEELNTIIIYLRNDVMATKGMFDKLWEYWKPFTEMIPFESISDLSWIRNSIASLIYKSACHVLNTEPTYGDSSGNIEEMGGRVIKPKYEEARKVWYIDFSSLYPHIFCMFNLFAEVEEEFPTKKFHKNKIFEAKGYYDISYQHPLSVEVQKKLKERIELQKIDKDHPLVYTIKIWVNGLYGVIRSAIFEKVHKKNAGWDCCWLGQQMHNFVQKSLEEFGFEVIGGDTDSHFIIANDEKNNNREYVEDCINKIINDILINVPFPVDTFNIKIEEYIDYIIFAFTEQPLVDPETGENIKKGNRLVKERSGIKKNYVYLYTEDGETKIKLVGIPLVKDTVTPLGLKIYNEVLKPEILKTKNGKFTKKFINDKINEYLKKPGVIDLLAVEYKVKPFSSYKVSKGKSEPTGIHAQVSRGYFGDGSGVIHLIKNNKVGNAGTGSKYCTIEEAKENNLTVNDLDLDKVYKELEVFTIYEKPIKKEKKKKEKEECID